MTFLAVISAGRSDAPTDASQLALPPIGGHRVMWLCEGPRSGLSIAVRRRLADLSERGVSAAAVVAALDPRADVDLRPFPGGPDAGKVRRRFVDVRSHRAMVSENSSKLLTVIHITRWI